MVQLGGYADRRKTQISDGQVIVAKMGAGQGASIGGTLSVNWNAKDCIAFQPERRAGHTPH